MKWPVLMLLTLSWVIPVQSQSRGIKSYYDAADHETHVETRNTAATNVKGTTVLTFQAWYYFKGRRQSPSKPPVLTVALTFKRELERFDDPDTDIAVNFLVDDKREGPYTALRKGHKNFAEIYFFEDNRADEILEKIAKGSKVQGEFETKKGKIEFELSPETISQFKELYERLHKN